MTGEVCGECGGTGVLVNDGPRSICGDCGGTGIEPGVIPRMELEVELEPEPEPLGINVSETVKAQSKGPGER
jgi:hypothetical protein